MKNLGLTREEKGRVGQRQREESFPQVPGFKVQLFARKLEKVGKETQRAGNAKDEKKREVLGGE